MYFVIRAAVLQISNNMALPTSAKAGVLDYQTRSLVSEVVLECTRVPKLPKKPKTGPAGVGEGRSGLFKSLAADAIASSTSPWRRGGGNGGEVPLVVSEVPPEALKKLKAVVKKKSEAAGVALELLMQRLSGAKKANIRILAVLTLEALMARSSVIRANFAQGAYLSVFVDNTISPDPLKNPLPGPPPAAKALRNHGLRLLKSWAVAWSDRYPSLGAMQAHVASRLGVDLFEPSSVTLARAEEAARTRWNGVREFWNEDLDSARGLLRTLQNALSLLAPDAGADPDDFVLNTFGPAPEDGHGGNGEDVAMDGEGDDEADEVEAAMAVLPAGGLEWSDGEDDDEEEGKGDDDDSGGKGKSLLRRLGFQVTDLGKGSEVERKEQLDAVDQAAREAVAELSRVWTSRVSRIVAAAADGHGGGARNEPSHPHDENDALAALRQATALQRELKSALEKATALKLDVPRARRPVKQPEPEIDAEEEEGLDFEDAEKEGYEQAAMTPRAGGAMVKTEESPEGEETPETEDKVLKETVNALAPWKSALSTVPVSEIASSLIRDRVKAAGREAGRRRTASMLSSSTTTTTTTTTSSSGYGPNPRTVSYNEEAMPEPVMLAAPSLEAAAEEAASSRRRRRRVSDGHLVPSAPPTLVVGDPLEAAEELQRRQKRSRVSGSVASAVHEAAAGSTALPMSLIHGIGVNTSLSSVRPADAVAVANYVSAPERSWGRKRKRQGWKELQAVTGPKVKGGNQY